MAFTSPQYWAHHQNQHRFQTPTNYINQLNPSVTSFQPTGNEMQRFQATMPPTPPPSTLTSPAEMMQMRNFMLQNHFSNTKEVVCLDRRTTKNTEDIEATREIVRNDMQTLQNEIEDLKHQFQAQRQDAGMIGRRSLADQDLSPPDEFTKHFSKERIAEVYLAEADDYEKAAAKLREQAEEISGGSVPKKIGVSQQLNSLSAAHDFEVKAEFACCGTIYASVQDMLEHFSGVHGFNARQRKDMLKQDEQIVTNGDEPETPTHIPPHRTGRGTDGRKIHHTGLGGEKEKATAQERASAKDREVQTNSLADEQTGTVFPPQPSEDPAEKQWIPLIVRQMPPTHPVATSNNETFTFDLLKAFFGGEEWSPGFYFVKNPQAQIKTYWILEEEHEPCLPSAPGLHGAKLTPFFNNTFSKLGEAPDESNYNCVPVFIRKAGNKREYTYFGHYSQTRFSDKIDTDHLLENVSAKIRCHHAEELANIGRPEWITQRLMEHFWPMPVYDGPIPTDSAISTPLTEETGETGKSVPLEKHVKQGLERYAEELKSWKKDARMRAMHLTTGHIIEAFQRPDEDEFPALRLYLEYLQFEKYEQQLYEFLREAKDRPLSKVSQVSRVNGAVQPLSLGGGGAVAVTNGVETAHPASMPKTKSTVRLSGKNAIPTKDSEQEWLEGGTGWSDTTTKPNTKGRTNTAKPVANIKSKKDEVVRETEVSKVDSPTKSTITAVKTGTNTKKDKPEERTGEQNVPGAAKAPNGDLAVAKQLQEEFKKSSGKGKGGSLPPHLRGK